MEPFYKQSERILGIPRKRSLTEKFQTIFCRFQEIVYDLKVYTKLEFPELSSEEFKAFIYFLKKVEDLLDPTVDQLDSESGTRHFSTKPQEDPLNLFERFHST